MSRRQCSRSVRYVVGLDVNVLASDLSAAGVLPFVDLSVGGSAATPMVALMSHNIPFEGLLALRVLMRPLLEVLGPKMLLRAGRGVGGPAGKFHRNWCSAPAVNPVLFVVSSVVVGGVQIGGSSAGVEVQCIAGTL